MPKRLGRHTARLVWLPMVLVALALAYARCGPPPAPAGETAPVVEAGQTAAAPLVDLPNARRPLPGMLTGGQPTPEQIEQAAAAGYRTIVNLRSSAEEGFEWEQDAVEAAGMRYELIEVAGAAGLTHDKVRALASVLSDPAVAPVMVHCSSGNRVGALLALKARWIDGASDEEAMKLGLEAGLTRLESKTRELLAAD